MKVFVSWSGDRSKAVASALKHWLPFVFQGLDVWMSEQNIQAGTKWGSELGKALGECKLGIICLTPESLKSHWLTFEAGALSTAINESLVIPYRFKLRSSDIKSTAVAIYGCGRGTRKAHSNLSKALMLGWEILCLTRR